MVSGCFFAWPVGVFPSILSICDPYLHTLSLPSSLFLALLAIFSGSLAVLAAQYRPLDAFFAKLHPQLWYAGPEADGTK
ncbi:MAG: hypothetical protein A4E48_00114 [Methanosaeta sp. PtaU1.Bin060]|nr:MAG: hypothetical protein A4E48_00114 [Methanosaeta sp. PtaU1.Bin060]